MVKYYYIELPKYRKAKTNMDDKLNQWLAIIDDTDWGKIEMAEKNNKTIKSALDDMEYLTGDEEVQRLAELREKWEMDWNSAISNATKRGIKQGKEIGERKTKIETAKKLLKKDVDIKIISEATGLSEEELEKMKLQLKNDII